MIAVPRNTNANTNTSYDDFATTSYDGTAAVWRINTNTNTYTNTNTNTNTISRLASLDGGAHSDKVLGLVLVHATSQIVTTGADGRVVLWSPSA